LFPIGRVLDVCLKFVIPAVLGYLLFSAVVEDIRQPYGGYPWLALILIGQEWLLFTLIVALFVTLRPWRHAIREHQD
jgi:NSS family neurotransmitter:Na+ symporter